MAKLIFQNMRLRYDDLDMVTKIYSDENILMEYRNRDDALKGEER